MNDVEAARAEPQVERLHVDDHFVADLRAADERDVGDRVRARALARVAASSITRLLLARPAGTIAYSAVNVGVGAVDLDDDGAAKLQHGRRKLQGRGGH